MRLVGGKLVSNQALDKRSISGADAYKMNAPATSNKVESPIRSRIPV